MSDSRLEIAADSLGRCHFCGLVRPESGMIRHLQACTTRRQVFHLPSSPATAASFHLLITPCGSPRVWQHIEVPAHLRMEQFAEWLTHLWPMLPQGALLINHQRVSDHDPINNLFVPGLIVRYETQDFCLHMQVVSWYDGYSQSDHTFVLMAQSLETPLNQSSN
ncbi:MAG: hypothetical protein M1294_03495 [Firmicutes bacterium]|uniref:Uncharacterized protein n=1 Tax=Sulfobacillus benefaciens TaxID=453960 RepID=A0A2T2XB86_9FIRM|nr:hypothetical protein [Bacillota bacterium]MCL5015816.1 hypothetical protein [Bacillota bacterium]PSR31728.1 MAG: hypothetical protein C7B43_00430 [Sulfobacillus benefaciens]HBQ95646.1 hypothetical protein [Sulfobacillus sp.]